MTFKDDHLDLQHLVREYVLLRQHNLQFKRGHPQDQILLFAEAAVILMALERFVRAILGADATEHDTLYTLLQKAVSRNLIRLPWDDQEEGIRKLKDVRNTILHGNFEQAAAQAGCTSVAEYFDTQFTAEIQRLGEIAEHLFGQIDPSTGVRTPRRSP